MSIFSAGTSSGQCKKNNTKLVTKLYKEGKTIREIAQIVHVSFLEIGRLINKYNGEKLSKVTSNRSKAYGMFLAGKPIIIVTIRLGLSYEEVKQYYHE